MYKKLGENNIKSCKIKCVLHNILKYGIFMQYKREIREQKDFYLFMIEILGEKVYDC